MKDDTLWYEAASVVGITNALNVVAAGLPADLLPPPPEPADDATGAILDEIRRFYGEVPAPFVTLTRDPAYLADVWAATRHAFEDQGLRRALKEALAFAVSLTSRSRFGTGRGPSAPAPGGAGS
jgi:hypothetical protein